MPYSFNAQFIGLVILAVPGKERQLLYKISVRDKRWGSVNFILSILLAACLSSGQNLDMFGCVVVSFKSASSM